MVNIKIFLLILCLLVPLLGTTSFLEKATIQQKENDNSLNYPFVQYDMEYFVHDITMSPNGKNIYLSYGLDGLSILNIEDPNNPFYLTYQYIPNHTGAIIEIVPSPDGKKLYLGMQDGIEVLDISDPVNIFQIGYFQNKFVKSIVLSSDGNTLYMNGNDIENNGNLVSSDGIVVLDVTNPEHITQVGFYDTSPVNDMVLSRNGKILYVVSDYTYTQSFEILNVSNPKNIIKISGALDAREDRAIQIVLSSDEKKAYITKSYEPHVEELPYFNVPYLSIFDISTLTNPVEISSEKRYDKYDIALSSNEKKLYFGNYDNGLGIMDVSTNKAVKLGYIDTNDIVLGFALSLDRTLAYVANGTQGFVIIDLSSDNTEVKKQVKNDFNNDGIADILWQKGKYYSLWYMKADGKHVYKYIGKTSTYKVVSTGDFNGDGIADILWQKGKYYALWYMKKDRKHVYKYIGQKTSPYKVIFP